MKRVADSREDPNFLFKIERPLLFKSRDLLRAT
jgi:hypothetical protein